MTSHKSGPRCDTMRSQSNDKRVNSAKDLDVYRLGYELAMEIFELSKHFPPEERFALTTQIRRSSRSVCLISARLGRSAVMRRILLAN